MASFALFGNWISCRSAPTDPPVLGGMALIVGVVPAGHALYRLTGRKLPAVVWVSMA